MKRTTLTILAAAMLSGCASAPLTDPELSILPAYILCRDFDARTNPRMQAETIRRGEITEAEWALIRSKQIAVGMSQTAMICSWGYPEGQFAAVNQFVDAYGATTQYVYPRGYSRYPGATYVYVRNGKVTAADRFD